MIEVARRRSITLLALGGMVMAMCLAFLVASPVSAQAEGWVNYCNNQKLGGQHEVPPPYFYCLGSERWYGSVMGEGDQHSVCVVASNGETMCTTGPNAWVYDPGDGVFRFGKPYISNSAPGWNIVHAVSWTP